MTAQPGTSLTARHLELIARLALGQQQRRIAAEMGVTENVVKNLTRTAMEALGGVNNANLVALAIAYGRLPANAATHPINLHGGHRGPVR
jgi:DNA-binding CsgD family transcriptional regulator